MLRLASSFLFLWSSAQSATCLFTSFVLVLYWQHSFASLTRLCFSDIFLSIFIYYLFISYTFFLISNFFSPSFNNFEFTAIAILCTRYFAARKSRLLLSSRNEIRNIDRWKDLKVKNCLSDWQCCLERTFPRISSLYPLYHSIFLFQTPGRVLWFRWYKELSVEFYPILFYYISPFRFPPFPQRMEQSCEDTSLSVLFR